MTEQNVHNLRTIGEEASEQVRTLQRVVSQDKNIAPFKVAIVAAFLF
ncbi:hypothetical protein PAEAM_44840 [Paenibacillus sp. GM1FR]|nr:hypothetical protein [Paenibacillus sp. GM1FR]PJN52649.1 hypothetical protein PAEAM_44840 [Paenibacillus sp. GM1FR]